MCVSFVHVLCLVRVCDTCCVHGTLVFLLFVCMSWSCVFCLESVMCVVTQSNYHKYNYIHDALQRGIWFCFNEH